MAKKLVNAQTEKLFEYDKNDLVEKPFEMLVPERLREGKPTSDMSFPDTVNISVAQTGRELYCLKENGQEFPVEISLNPLQTEEGLLISAAIRDISERKYMVAQRLEAEEALRRPMTNFSRE